MQVGAKQQKPGEERGCLFDFFFFFLFSFYFFLVFFSPVAHMLFLFSLLRASCSPFPFPINFLSIENAN